MFINACLYYLRCTTRNRVLGMLRRMRQPKYLIGMLAIAAYVYVFFIRNSFLENVSPSEQRQIAVAGVALMGLLQISTAWIMPGRGLAFRESEVQFLFPRPFSRFQLLMFKWVVGQFPLLFSGFIIGLIFGRTSAFTFTFFVLGFWLSQTAITTHALLYGLCRSQFKSKLRLIPGIAFLAAVPILAVFAWTSIGGAQTLPEFLALTETKPLSYLLDPIKILATPVAAQSLPEFLQAALIPIGVILIHLVVIRWSNLPFEDDALALAAKIQEVRRSGLRGLRSKKTLVLAKPGSPWQLAPIGRDWQALVWKNVISITRFSKQTILRIAGVTFILAYVLSTRGGDFWGGTGTTRIGFGLLAVIGYVTLLGPALIRVDLRIDIPHFDVLKSMPIRARSLIFGEVMGTVIVLWVVQATVIVIAAIFITEEEGQRFGWDLKAPLTAAALIALFSFDFALLTCENFIALWMPGFVRLGRGAKPSLDQMGPYILGALVKLNVLFVFLLPAGLVGTAVGYLCKYLGLPLIPAVSIGIAAGSVILAWAGFAAIQLSEARYNRFDITSERIGTE